MAGLLNLAKAAGNIPAPKPSNDLLRAFHGSPYDFDKFSIDEIGTGEGAQAYGHGLYFAEKEGVARSYRDALTNRKGPNITYKGKGFKDLDGPEYRALTQMEREIKFNRSLNSKQAKEQALTGLRLRKKQAMERSFGSDSLTMNRVAKNHDEDIAALERMDPDDINFGGKMYEVDIDASPDQLLDYDAPLYEQSENVQNILRKNEKKLTKDLYLNLNTGIEDLINAPNQSGEGLYSLIRTERRGEEEASEYLNDLGIKGIRYKDAFSRGTDGGSSNYVIFDDRLISISKKYGIPIPAAAAMLAGQSEEAEAGLLSAFNRASALGFDTKTPVYHGSGTSSPITEFEPGRAGLSYFSEDPDYSKGYASGGNPVGKFFLKKGKQFDTVGNPEHKKQMIKLFNDRGGWKSMAEGDGYSSAKEYFSDVGGEGRTTFKYDKRYDDDWEILDNPETDILGDLFNEGYESFRFQERRPSKEFPKGVVSQAVADPSRIRSVDAAFDPNKTDSGNIIASGGPVAAGLLGAAAMQPEEAEAGPIAAGARRIIDPRFSQPIGGGAVRKGLLDPMGTLGAEITPRGISTGPSFQLSDFEGQPYIISQSDRSAAGGILNAVGGTQIDPVDLRGGRDFMFENPGMAWASDPKVVNSLLERATKLKEGSGQNPLLLPYTMAPTGIDFATMPLDTMVNFARSNMSKTNIKKLDRQIKKIIPKWGGVANPGSNAIFRDSTGDQRKMVADVIDKQFKDVKGGLSIAEARAVTSDAKQYLSNDGSMVNIGRIDASRPAIADSGHPTYKGGLPGEGVGTFQEPLDIRKFVANNGRVVTNKPSDIRAASMNPALTQGIIDEKLLRAQEGSINPRLLGGIAAGSAATAAAPTLADQGAGLLDFLANAAQGAIAPISNAPNTIIQALTSDRSNEQLKADRDARLAANDYQLRTDLGQQYTQQAQQTIGGLLQSLVEQAERSRIVNAAKNSRILQTIPNAYNQLPERGRIVGNALLDSFL